MSSWVGLGDSTLWVKLQADYPDFLHLRASLAPQMVLFTVCQGCHMHPVCHMNSVQISGG